MSPCRGSDFPALAMRLPFARKSPPYDPLRPGEPRPGSIPPELLDRIRAIEIKARRLVNDLFLGEYHAVFRRTSQATTSARSTGRPLPAPGPR